MGSEIVSSWRGDIDRLNGKNGCLEGWKEEVVKMTKGEILKELKTCRGLLVDM